MKTAVLVFVIVTAVACGPTPITVSELQAGEPPCTVLWDTPLGEFWGRSEDGELLELLLGEQLSQEIYENDIVSVKEGDIVLDIGGHLGTFTRAALKGGASLVVAFEPEPTNITCFKKTFAQELADRKVVLVEAAAMETSGTVAFELQTTNNTGTGAVTKRGRLSVRAVSIDETVKDLAIERVGFIKMDIEGAERFALAGASETLTRDAPRMAICIYHHPDDPTLVPQAVLDSQPGYEVVTTGTQAYFSLPSITVSYEGELQQWTRDDHPIEWARGMLNDGNTYMQRPGVDRAGSAAKAIRCYRLAQLGYTREKHPVVWALTMMYLGDAHWELPGPDRAANLEEAVRFYEQAVSVFVAQDIMDSAVLARHKLSVTSAELATLRSSKEVATFE